MKVVTKTRHQELDQHRPGLAGEGARDGDSLHLAARQLLRVAVAEALQLHQLQQLLHPAAGMQRSVKAPLAGTPATALQLLATLRFATKVTLDSSDTVEGAFPSFEVNTTSAPVLVPHPTLKLTVEMMVLMSLQQWHGAATASHAYLASLSTGSRRMRMPKAMFCATVMWLNSA